MTSLAPGLSNNLKDLSILYVEDDEEIRDQLSQFLRRRVGTLHTAVNGREGLAAFRAHRPDIVISDIRMPIMDGLDMVDAIKREWPTTPVIMTTAFNETDYFLRAIDIGVDKYVLKPVSVDTLVDAIDRSASGLHAERQLRLAATVFATAAEAILIVDRLQRIVVANPACDQILGYPSDTLPGLALGALGADGQASLTGTPWADIRADETWHGEVWLKRRDGQPFPAWLSAARAREADSRDALLVLVFLDISERKRRESEILMLNTELYAARNELEDRVEERTRELVAARNAAELASQAKSRFLSQMSHELRTPMNAILGLTELLHTDTRHPLQPGQKAYTGEILRAGWHLLELINDVLDMARVEAGKMVLNIEPTTLGEVFRDCQELIRPVAERRQIRIHPAPDALNRLTVRADRVRLKQVLINLLSNAIKYNRDGGRVDIVYRVADGRLFLGVSDTGLGIKPEDLKHLFKPFERFGEAVITQEGTGIGLALSQRLAEMMNARITVDSETGVGSTFWVELELVAGVEPIAGGTGGTSKVQRPLAMPLDRADRLKGRSVLYIEDNAVNLAYMKALFASLPDTRLLTAKQPEEGLATAIEEHPDTILVGTHLPGMSGQELLARLRQEATLVGVPVVALGDDPMPEDIQRATAGFDDYLTKPVQAEKLFECLLRLVGRR
jgi:PAS domain S-box-containing protein